MTRPGQRVFITGGASGLGRELALRFAGAGWRVCIADLHEQRGAETAALLGPGAEYLRCDVTSEEELLAAARRLEERWGGVDFYVLPHRAGRTAWWLKRLLPRRLYRAAAAGQHRRLRAWFASRRAAAGGATGEG